ncbi:MAG: DUF3341 domain-containing protein [Gemmatimonadaceae bacterium]|nr:DUF3341 domain-containing protein [Gemmatimonadaceae bacterium]
MMQGMLGHFKELDSTVEAIEALKKAKLGDLTVFTPTPRHELEHAVDGPPSPVRRWTLIGALSGAMFGYWIAIWASEYWPLVVGGKAISTWIPYTIFGFEVMVLVGALSTVAGMFVNSRIPRLTMTVGYDPRFSHGDYGVWIACAPEKHAQAAEILKHAGAVEVRGER